MISMAGNTQSNQISKFIGGIPISIEQSKGLDMMNIKPNRPCFLTAGTAFIAVSSQCFLSLLIPIRAVIRFITTLISGMIFRFSSNEIIPTVLRAEASFVTFTEFTFAGLFKFPPAMLTNMKYRGLSQPRLRFASAGFTHSFSPSFISNIRLSSPISYAFAFVGTIFCIRIARIDIKFFSTDKAGFNNIFCTGSPICLNTFKSFIPRWASLFGISVKTSHRAIILFFSYRNKTFTAIRTNLTRNCNHHYHYSTGVASC